VTRVGLRILSTHATAPQTTARAVSRSVVSWPTAVTSPWAINISRASRPSSAVKPMSSDKDDQTSPSNSNPVPSVLACAAIQAMSAAACVLPRPSSPVHPNQRDHRSKSDISILAAPLGLMLKPNYKEIPITGQKPSGAHRRRGTGAGRGPGQRSARSSLTYSEMARPKGFEPLTPRFVVWCSIQLSYGRIRTMRPAKAAGPPRFEPGSQRAATSNRLARRAQDLRRTSRKAPQPAPGIEGGLGRDGPKNSRRATASSGVAPYRMSVQASETIKRRMSRPGSGGDFDASPLPSSPHVTRRDRAHRTGRPRPRRCRAG
jgi:hypothetical protein